MRGGEVQSEDESAHEEEKSEGEDESDLAKEIRRANMAAPKGGISNASEMIVFGHPSDSGIGTDMPTAQFEGGSDYFKRG